MEKPPRHRHRYTKPRYLSTVGWVKACTAKACPRRMKAVHPDLVKVGGTNGKA